MPFPPGRPCNAQKKMKGHLMDSSWHYFYNHTQIDRDSNEGHKCTLIGVNSSLSSPMWTASCRLHSPQQPLSASCAVIGQRTRSLSSSTHQGAASPLQPGYTDSGSWQEAGGDGRKRCGCISPHHLNCWMRVMRTQKLVFNSRSRVLRFHLNDLIGRESAGSR